MNIDVKMTYLKYILLAGIMCTFASCHREDGPLQLPEGNPIELSATSDWPKFTKSFIDDIIDLKDDGFVAWGDLTTSNNETVTVFDATPVTAIFEDDNVTNWEYSPQQYWQTGTYNFAALLPKSKVYDNISAIITDNGALKLTSGSITLGGNNADPVDLMYALSGTIDNTEKEGQPRPDAPVELTFKHLWAQLGFEVVSADPNKAIDITAIRIYGNGLPSYIDFKDATESVTISINEDEEDKILNFSSALGDATTNEEPFAVFTKPDNVEDAAQWTVVSTAARLVDKLMVFPFNFTEENSVFIEVSFLNNGTTETVTGEITNGTWLSGKKYVYTLQIQLAAANIITITGNPITDWTDTNINHTFE